MANKNKNIKRLVARTDNDPTLAINVTESLSNQIRNFESETEVDAKTIDADELNYVANSRSGVELEIALHEQIKIVGELSFDVEHLRSRRRGLEEELKARGEIEKNLNRENRAFRGQLADAMRTLESRNKEFRATQAALGKSGLLVERLNDAASELSAAVIDFKRKIRSLESEFRSARSRTDALEEDLQKERQLLQKTVRHSASNDKRVSALDLELKTSQTELVDLRNYIDGRKEEWSLLEREIAEAREQLTIHRSETGRIVREIDERNSQLDRSREQCIITSDLLSQEKEKVRMLNERICELEQALEYDSGQRIVPSQDRIAENSGILVAQVHELKSLRKDNARIERYSDSLRAQLQEQVSISKASVSTRRKLEAGLAAANEMIGNLTKQLGEEKRLNAEHAENIESLQSNFEREVRQIRFELGTAEETIADQHSLNEQLTSDLVDNQGFRQELESQLGNTQQECEQSIQVLTTKLKLARREVDDHERTLNNKNSAIADLVRELSKHTSNIELRGNVENVLKKIDGFRTDKKGATDSAERSRVARLLIGKADGREVRFPLFKNRLTIGRTSHNDIQLNMQYVSRRHAVISTDQGETRVIDWGSKNGVFVNEIQVTEQILKSGDIVSIGTADFKYQERVKRQGTSY